MVVVAGLFCGGKLLFGNGKIAKYKKIISGVEITTPDLAKIQDGTYTGDFDAILVSADVDVMVKDHKITEIRINKHDNGRGKKAEAITDQVIAKQSLAVDTVSGATNSSKVILKAIENALEKGQN